MDAIWTEAIEAAWRASKEWGTFSGDNIANAILNLKRPEETGISDAVILFSRKE